jgi:metal-responsive CopG/Arc/MetJ family transcriptional regulator
MSKMKVAVTLDAVLVDQIDALVEAHRFPSRSQAIESAVSEKLARITRLRLATECAKLGPADERAFAEEGLAEDAASWPAY